MFFFVHFFSTESFGFKLSFKISLIFLWKICHFCFLIHALAMSCVISMSFWFNFVPLSARLSASSMSSTLYSDGIHNILTNPLTLLLWVFIFLVQPWQSFQLSFFRTACTNRQISPATKLSLSSIALFLSLIKIPAPPLSSLLLVDPSVQMTNSTSWLLLLPGC